MLQQDINRVIFEFTATQSFHCRYININIAKFKNSKWQKQKVMWPKWWNILVTWLNENWNRVWNFLWRCWQFSDFRNKKEFFCQNKLCSATKDFRTPFDVIMIYTKQSAPLAVDNSVNGCDWLVTEMTSAVRLSSNTSRFSTSEKLEWTLVII